MVRSRLLFLVLATLAAMSLAACVDRVAEDDDGAAGDRPVPTPVPTEPIDDDDNDGVDEQATPTPASTPGERNGEWFHLLETDKTYPEDEVGDQILALTESQEAFDEWQERFQLGEIPDADGIDWDQQVVLFAGTGESGSCPLELVGVQFDDDDRLVNVMATREGDDDMMCTMDWTPRVFVISLDQAVLGDDELFGVITDPDHDQEIDPDQWITIRE